MIWAISAFIAVMSLGVFGFCIERIVEIGRDPDSADKPVVAVYAIMAPYAGGAGFGLLLGMVCLLGAAILWDQGRLMRRLRKIEAAVAREPAKRVEPRV